MRGIILLMVSALTAFQVHAQQIKGTAMDAEGKPVAGATISLLKDTGTAVIKLAVTNQNGQYHFIGMPAGQYRVSSSFVGYQPSVSAPFTFSGTGDVSAPALKMVKAASSMENIVVTARKPMVEVKADKTILNVEGTVNAVGSDAMELLRKSPGVLVDKDDNLSLAGKNGVQVYIDGRPTPLAGQDLANYLKSIQSSNIEAIELITNPSAKYEAAGNAGIINIRLKKNKSLGTNGSVNAGVNFGYYPKYNAGFALNYRNRNMNIYGNYNTNQSRMRQTMKIKRSLLDTLFEQESKVNMDMSAHNYKAGVDFFVNKKSTVGAMVNGTIANPTFNNYSRTPISYIPTGIVDRVLVADNSSKMKRNNLNLNLNYAYNSADGKSLNLNADHGTYDINNDQYQPNFYYDATEQTITSSVIYRMLSPSEIRISSFKADWEQNFKGGKLGFGGKTALIKTDNDFQRYDVFGSSMQLDRDRSNLFNYRENINAAYVNYNRPFKGFMIQAGLRLENTNTEGISEGQRNNGSGYVKYDSTFHRNYTDLFPSAAVTFNKNPMSQLSITYSRRIDRPVYQDMNPFEFKLDEYTFQKGNINLRPQYTNSFGITHTYKYKLNTTLNYSHVKDMFVQLIDTAEISKSFISKRNLATQDIINLNISYPFMYKNYSLFGNLSTNYSKYKADFGEGRKVDLDAFGFSFFAQNSLKFGKTKTWTAELSGFYNAPTVYMGSFEGRSLWSVDAGIQKQVMNGKGTIKASVSDVFGSMQFRGVSNFAGQRSEFSSTWDAQQFKLNFVFRFGSAQIKAARNRTTGAEEEAKRAKSDGGGIGIGQ